jgi:hypothetical protein
MPDLRNDSDKITAPRPQKNRRKNAYLQTMWKRGYSTIKKESIREGSFAICCSSLPMQGLQPSVLRFDSRA